MEAVKAKKARLFGYGHRVHRKRDPRAALIKEVMPLEDLTSPLLQMAFEVDRAVRKVPYFIELGLYANVDLYGSFPYLALQVTPYPELSVPTLTSCCLGASKKTSSLP